MREWWCFLFRRWMGHGAWALRADHVRKLEFAAKIGRHYVSFTGAGGRAGIDKAGKQLGMLVGWQVDCSRANERVHI